MLDRLVRSFLYHPLKLDRGAPVPDYCGGAEEIWIESGANEVHGLYWKAEPGRPTILFFHGNAQSVFEWCLVREELAPMECGLLLIDYPGYGKSTGTPSEEALLQAGDDSFHWLESVAGVDGGRVVAFGKSLGGPVAAHVACRHRVLGLVLESTFRSLLHVVRKLVPVLPAGAILKSELYETEVRRGRVRAPVLVPQGTRDALIQFGGGRALLELVPGEGSAYWVEGAGHNDVSLMAGDEYGERLRAWLQTLI